MQMCAYLIKQIWTGLRLHESSQCKGADLLEAALYVVLIVFVVAIAGSDLGSAL